MGPAGGRPARREGLGIYTPERPLLESPREHRQRRSDAEGPERPAPARYSKLSRSRRSQGGSSPPAAARAPLSPRSAASIPCASPASIPAVVAPCTRRSVSSTPVAVATSSSCRRPRARCRRVTASAKRAVSSALLALRLPSRALNRPARLPRLHVVSVSPALGPDRLALGRPVEDSGDPFAAGQVREVLRQQSVPVAGRAACAAGAQLVREHTEGVTGLRRRGPRPLLAISSAA